MHSQQDGSGDIYRESTAPLSASVVDNSGGVYPTERWHADYFSVSRRGLLSTHCVAVNVPAGLAQVCPPIRLGQSGCIYGVRRWGFALRPSALNAAGLIPAPALATITDAELLNTFLQAASFDLPGEFVIASPEHPFRLLAPGGQLCGSSTDWCSYLGALSFFVSGGRVTASFLRLWAEAEASYRQAVELCLAALAAAPSPHG